MNGQVCYLRHLLNGAFPSADGRIRIEDGQAIGQWRFAWDECFDPYASYLLINETGTLFWDTDTILEGVNNFRVILPAVFMENKNDVDKIKSLINEYKLLSKSYSINYE
jgi:hypothetical protein